MTWVDETPNPALRRAYDEVAALAEWSSWVPFASALQAAPRAPGVYLLREAQGPIRYVGMAGERAGSGRPQGIYGRLNVYRTGKGAVSGFGEAALDRALADPVWVEAQLQQLRDDGPRRAKEWARDAVTRLGAEVSWAVRADKADALLLEKLVVALLRPYGLWNR